MSQHINPTPKQTDIDSLNSNINLVYKSSGSVLSIADTVGAGKTAWFYVTSGTTDRPSGSGGGYMRVMRYIESQYTYLRVVFYNSSDNRAWVNTKWGGTTWSGWEELVLSSKLNNIIGTNYVATKLTFHCSVLVEQKQIPILLVGASDIICVILHAVNYTAVSIKTGETKECTYDISNRNIVVSGLDYSRYYLIIFDPSEILSVTASTD